MFSRALNKLLVIAGNSDWFIGAFVPVVIGRSNYFVLGSWQLFENRSLLLKLLFNYSGFLCQHNFLKLENKNGNIVLMLLGDFLNFPRGMLFQIL